MSSTAGSRILAVLLWLPSVTFLAFAVVVAVTGRGAVEGDAAAAPAFALIIFAFSTTGLLLAIRVSSNRIGWIFLISGVLGSLYVLARGATHAALDTGSEIARYAATVEAAVYFPWILTMVALPILLFPTGEPPSPRWNWITRVILVTIGVAVVMSAFSTDPLVDYDGVDNPVLTSPFGIDVLGAIDGSPFFMIVATALILLSLIGPAAALVVRFRRSEGVERQQLKWLALAASVAAVGLTIAYTVGEFVEPVREVSTVIGLLGLLGIPIAIGLAITRYRLYDIDRLINRTVVFGLVVGTLTVVFVVGAGWLPTVLPTSNSNLAVAASTLIVFLLFQPLRRRVQAGVDRRFYRSKYNAQQVADGFAARLRHLIDADQVAGQLVDVVGRTVQPRTVSVWIKKPGDQTSRSS